MPKGGARPGAGRKKVHDELEVRNLAIKAIERVYGSKIKGFEGLLRTGEPTLVKFVFEHGFGKPTDKVQHSTDPEAPIIFKLDERFTDSD
jgi:hypothetical protein